MTLPIETKNLSLIITCTFDCTFTCTSEINSFFNLNSICSCLHSWILLVILNSDKMVPKWLLPLSEMETKYQAPWIYDHDNWIHQWVHLWILVEPREF